MTVGVYDNCYTCWNRCPIDPGDKGICVLFSCANTNCVGLARNASVGNIDIVAASGQISTGFSAQCDVEGTSGIARKCIVTEGCVVVASCIEIERKTAGGRVAVAVCVEKKRLNAAGCVAVTGCVAKERKITVRYVVVTGCTGCERKKTI